MSVPTIDAQKLKSLREIASSLKAIAKSLDNINLYLINKNKNSFSDEYAKVINIEGDDLK